MVIVIVKITPCLCVQIKVIVMVIVIVKMSPLATVFERAAVVCRNLALLS